MTFNNFSIELTKSLKTEIKKQQGIFFTSSDTVSQILNNLNFENVKNILEPSCGSCEFVFAINKLYPDIKIDAVELNTEIYNTITGQDFENITFYNEDFLKKNFDKKYDLIIGNPPFFTIGKNEVSSGYYKYFSGRPNIYIIFILKSLELLEENGTVCFVLPQNFLNCLYYKKTREYIYNNYTILDIQTLSSSFLETKQETILLSVKNEKPAFNDSFLFEKTFMTLGNEVEISSLKEIISGSKTLNELGFVCKVGTVVWNQNKPLLTNSSENNTKLVYASTLNNGILQLETIDKNKPGYISNKEAITDCVLLVNRGYGKGKFKLNYSIMTGDYPYLVENHVIIIKSKTKPTIGNYKKLIKSFEDPRTEKFIKSYFKNNSMNTTELNYILPIYQ